MTALDLCFECKNPIKPYLFKVCETVYMIKMYFNGKYEKIQHAWLVLEHCSLFCAPTTPFHMLNCRGGTRHLSHEMRRDETRD